jgi:thioredoxin reductase
MQEDTGFRLVLAEAEKPTLTLSARALVIATGLRLKSSEMWRAIPSAKPLYQAGLLSFFPLDHLADTALAGQRVAVIGGGDNAHFTAKDLASSAAIVHLIIRSKPKAQPKVREAIEALIGQGILREYVGATIGKLEQQPGGIVIDLTRNDGKLEQIEVDRIFARTGFAPNTDDLAALGPLAGLAIDAAGYVQVDAGKRTSLPAVYAIGDVANPDHPAIVTAIADGAVAARAIALDFGA